MGPYNELTQWKRKATVLTLLQRDDLSAWARNYWGTVFDTIAVDEARYNNRVTETYKNLTPPSKGYISYE
jgi:hypothetical protein|tara:strand:- start:228 stop:437 length:210 start_codon:yes stop_codon:yes gene_type:complete